MKKIILYVSAYVLIRTVISALGLLGHLRGNAVKVSHNQFKDIYAIAQAQADQLGLDDAPTIYVIEGHGMFNAFAMRFFFRNYVVLFSKVLESAYKQGGQDAVAFVIAHELGHLKLGHVTWWHVFLTLPASVILFPLGLAYSRVCEYEADAVATRLARKGVKQGIIALAVGPYLAGKVDHEAYLSDAVEDKGFATWYSMVFSTHPHVADRLMQASRLLEK